MTATERLRQLLDDRGVEWHGDGDSTYWGEVLLARRDGSNPVYKFGAHKTADRLSVHLLQVTPEQAVEATLGRRTCHIDYHFGEWYCTGCGNMVGTCDPDSELHIDGNAIELWSFCPNCGRRVVE